MEKKYAYDTIINVVSEVTFEAEADWRFAGEALSKAIADVPLDPNPIKGYALARVTVDALQEYTKKCRYTYERRERIEQEMRCYYKKLRENQGRNES